MILSTAEEATGTTGYVAIVDRMGEGDAGLYIPKNADPDTLIPLLQKRVLEFGKKLRAIDALDSLTPRLLAAALIAASVDANGVPTFLPCDSEEAQDDVGDFAYSIECRADGPFMSVGGYSYRDGRYLDLDKYSGAKPSKSSDRETN